MSDTHENYITYKPIGFIYSSHTDQKQTPVQPVFAKGIKGKIEIYEEFSDGLKDLDGFSHIYLIYHFHKEENVKLMIKPFLQDVEHGVFATRAPNRPNSIGMSVVKIEKIEKNIIYISDVDILNETPLLDIKPYVKRFDYRENVRSGWQDEVDDIEANKKGLRDYKE